jgi:hypothetical protein
MTSIDARLWHPWLRINRVLRAMLHERWSAEAWPQVKAEFKKALALKSQIRRLLVAALLLAGCATLPTYSEGPWMDLDKDTRYAVEDRPGGFLVTVEHTRFQFIPEQGVVAATCRAAVTSTAHAVAEKRGRRLRVVNEQRVMISTARNPWAGITSCTAQVPVEYAP